MTDQPPKPGSPNPAPQPLDDAALDQVAGGLLTDSQLSTMTPQQIQQLLGGTIGQP